MPPKQLNRPYALFLLPSPPSSSFEGVRDAYEPAFSALYSKLSEALDGANSIALLDIAVEVPGVLSSSPPRSRLFASLQRLLANVYKLVCAVSAAKNIELDVPGGIDTRVVFVDSNTARDSLLSGGSSGLGPIICLQTLAASARPWDSIFYPESTGGKNLIAKFTSSLDRQGHDRHAGNIHALPNGHNRTTSEPLLVPEGQQSPSLHYSVAVGGTFDHLHIGHKLLLTATVLALDPVKDTSPGKERHVIVGVTGDELLVKKKYAEFLESWDERCQSTTSFLMAIMDFSPPESGAPSTERVSGPGPNEKYILTKVRSDLILRLVQLSDACGPTITEENIDALVISEETRSGGKFINDERAKKGWKGLAIFEVDVLSSGEVATATGVDAESFGSKISSTDIRRRRMESAWK